MFRIEVDDDENRTRDTRLAHKPGQHRRKDGLSVRPASRPLGDVTNKASQALGTSSESAPAQQVVARRRAKLGDITNKGLPPVESFSLCEPSKPQSYDRSGLDPDGCAAAALALIAPCFATSSFGTPCADKWTATRFEGLPTPQLLRAFEDAAPLPPLSSLAAVVASPAQPRASVTGPSVGGRELLSAEIDGFCVPPAAGELCVPAEEAVPEEMFSRVQISADSDDADSDMDMELESD
uniref:Uncharacterized protein n=1 Tax=Coccolithus braarudii TaxID=221442 RepID=A0A7S0L5J8_9EUKA|mmetsp:Transcript_16435/g.35591  ORF Transcript_16435/g.35591 Transcript_16435/m.35591 type:complete len:238 (+) Transcript_16435:73-786(+)|eukprot:CAMPEP_0183350236 /NCGR_PEP_ID=MMETSP0164_2-20130417/18336_1 /TAXON_ID=221442 /ORGANISM="Coccolithus pelagicus ssp braarudi, Strain PLY182g" /LENGTH=237 /DNA_ID=CAMNT_0025522123 /DNA_START=73 /DNA_END=786 /DNA_ORIENTATION=+